MWNDLEMRDEPGWGDILDNLDSCTSGGLLMAVVLVVVYALDVYGTVAHHRR